MFKTDPDNVLVTFELLLEITKPENWYNSIELIKLIINDRFTAHFSVSCLHDWNHHFHQHYIDYERWNQEEKRSEIPVWSFLVSRFINVENTEHDKVWLDKSIKWTDVNMLVEVCCSFLCINVATDDVEEITECDDNDCTQHRKYLDVWKRSYCQPNIVSCLWKKTKEVV